MILQLNDDDVEVEVNRVRDVVVEINLNRGLVNSRPERIVCEDRDSEWIIPLVKGWLEGKQATCVVSQRVSSVSAEIRR
jgi:hypothetical protein